MATIIHGSPFANGTSAYQKGKTIHDSPYPQGSKERTKWVNGWWAGEKAAKKAAEQAALDAINARPLPDWAALEAGK
jgi:hypothetical protein